MPISYNPGVSHDSQSFALGLATFGNAVSQAIEQKNEEAKRRAQVHKSLKTYAVSAGIMDKDDAEVMGLEELEGTIKGAHFKSTLEEAKAKAEDRAMRRQVDAEQLKEILGRNRAAGALPDFAKSFSQRMRPPMMSAGDPSAAQAGALADASQAAASPQFHNLMGALQEAHGGASGGPIAFEEDPMTGARFGRLGRSMQPSGINPEKMKPSLQTIYDADGNPYPVAQDPRSGRLTFAPQGGAARERKLSIEATVEAEKALQKLDDEIEFWNSASAKAKSDPKRPAPDPERLKDLKSRRQRIAGLLADEPAAKPDAAPPPAEGVVRVKGPDGRTGTIPRANLDKAKKAGYTEVP